MTFIDSEDLRHRTCPRCGAVYGDALTHRRWHRDLDALIDEHLVPTIEQAAAVIRLVAEEAGLVLPEGRQ